jgi:hypothetical protein
MPKIPTLWSAPTKPATAWTPAVSKPQTAWTKATTAAKSAWVQTTKPASKWSKLFKGFIPQPYDSAQLTYDSPTRSYDGIATDKTPTNWTNV